MSFTSNSVLIIDRSFQCTQASLSQYDAGLYTSGSTNMIVSRGLGNSIIPIRFNNRPEVVVIELLNMDC